MDKNLHSDGKDIAETLKKTLSTLENVKNQALSKLTPEQLKEIQPITADFSRVMDAAKKGNGDELNNFISKYADIH